ncbi:TonB-dependent receptor, partial [Acinetobacter nematophilus]
MEHIMSVIFKPTAVVGAVAFAMGLSSTTFDEQQDQTSNSTASMSPIVLTATPYEENLKNIPVR